MAVLQPFTPNLSYCLWKYGLVDNITSYVNPGVKIPTTIEHHLPQDTTVLQPQHDDLLRYFQVQQGYMGQYLNTISQQLYQLQQQLQIQQQAEQPQQAPPQHHHHHHHRQPEQQLQSASPIPLEPLPRRASPRSSLPLPQQQQQQFQPQADEQARPQDRNERGVEEDHEDLPTQGKKLNCILEHVPRDRLFYDPVIWHVKVPYAQGNVRHHTFPYDEPAFWPLSLLLCIEIDVETIFDRPPLHTMDALNGPWDVIWVYGRNALYVTVLDVFDALQRYFQKPVRLRTGPAAHRHDFCRLGQEWFGGLEMTKGGDTFRLRLKSFDSLLPRMDGVQPATGPSDIPHPPVPHPPRSPRSPPRIPTPVAHLPTLENASQQAESLAPVGRTAEYGFTAVLQYPISRLRWSINQMPEPQGITRHESELSAWDDPAVPTNLDLMVFTIRLPTGIALPDEEKQLWGDIRVEAAGHYITVGEVLLAIYHFFQTPLTHREISKVSEDTWDSEIMPYIRSREARSHEPVRADLFKGATIFLGLARVDESTSHLGLEASLQVHTSILLP